ncbi:MAG: T9SS type A sorting domain-containing protein [Candidatus Marinimicrobia bacterium]|nr:T9SS type A sorting domain-containing protein [Candidatus Neomarinimicrobiota bacterium]
MNEKIVQLSKLWFQILFGLNLLMAQEPITFSGESEPFELDGIAPIVEWLSPQNDEYFDRGETITVNWDSSDDSFSDFPIAIILSSIAGELLSEWNDIENSGNAVLTLPEINFTDASFNITATDNYGNTASDNADGEIHIGFVEPISFSGESDAFVLDGVAPSVMMISPNGGEEYIIGENIQVSWVAEDDSPDGDATLHISTNASANFEVIESGLSFSGSTNITLPDIITDNAIIKIQATDYFGNSSTDESDNTFNIGPIPDILFSGLSAQFKLDSVDPLVTWLSPNGGEILEANWNSMVSWSAMDDSFSETPISISYSASDLGISNELLAENVENTSSLNIIMPNISSDSVSFHIQAIDEFGNTNSDNSDEANAIHHFGCTDTEADNYDVNAEIDDGICVFTYSLELHEGANLVSFPILPADGSIGLVMGSLGVNITGVIGEGVGATQQSPGVWVGSLNNISRTSGYWLLMVESDILTFTGTRTSPEIVYNLNEGANLVSWPFTSSNDIEPALPDDIETAITGIISEGTASTQIAPGTWVGSLGAFESGKGYWLKITMDIELVYETPTLGRVAVSGQFMDVNNGMINNPIELFYEQSVQQAFYFIESIDGIQMGDWIIASNGNELIGARQWNGKYTDIPIMGNDGSNLTTGYIKEGMVPQFKLFQKGEYIDLSGDIPAWSNNELFMAGRLSESTPYPESFSLEKAYPNPFNPTTTLNITIPVDSEVSLSIYNLQGREVSTLISGNMEAGYHSVVWNADSYSSGAYFVKMVAGEFVNTQKLMLVK